MASELLFSSPGAVFVLAQELTAPGAKNPSQPAMEAARLKTLHAIGVALAGRNLPVVEAAARVISGRTGSCSAVGLAGRFAGEAASFFNGVAAHASLLEDCGPGGLRQGSHPGTYVFPAALAAAELVDADAGKFLRGMIVGYEAVARLGAYAPAAIVARKFRPIGIMGPFGAAAAAAFIFGASVEEMAGALSLASNAAGGSTQGVFEGTMEAFFQAGTAARNGLFAAELAMAGVQTAAQSLEGSYGFLETYGGEAGDFDALPESAAEPGICAVGVKRFATCLQNQQTLALIVDGLKRPLRANEIRRVTITRPATGTNGLNSPGVSRSGEFANRFAAQMSARFTAAGAMLGAAVDDPLFYEAHHADPEYRALTDRIELVHAHDDAIRVEIDVEGADPIHLEGHVPELLNPSFETVAKRVVARVSPEQAEAVRGIVAAIRGMDDSLSMREFAQGLSAL